MADAIHCIYKIRKPSPCDEGSQMSLRAIACTWQCQTMMDADRTLIKGVQMARMGHTGNQTTRKAYIPGRGNMGN